LITYLYICGMCGRFEAQQSIKDEPLAVCPTCGAPVKRQVGGGLAINDLPAYMSDENINSRSRHREWLGTSQAKAMDLERAGDDDE
jgi:putative FmdB family regulatory protein